MNTRSKHKNPDVHARFIIKKVSINFLDLSIIYQNYINLAVFTLAGSTINCRAPICLTSPSVNSLPDVGIFEMDELSDYGKNIASRCTFAGDSLLTIPNYL